MSLVAHSTPPDDEGTPALPVLVERHLDALRSYVQVSIGPKLRTKEAVSDIVQSAVRELLTNSGRFDLRSVPQFLAYLRGVADHKIANKRRHYFEAAMRSAKEEPISAVAHGLFDPTRTPSELCVTAEEIDRLHAALDALEESDRELFSLHKLLGIPMAAIARERRCPESTVRSRIDRIMALLTFRLGGRVAPES